METSFTVVKSLGPSPCGKYLGTELPAESSCLHLMAFKGSPQLTVCP